MGAVLRFLMLVIVSVLVSGAMVLVITARMLGNLSPAQIGARWGSLVSTGQPIADLAREYYGLEPPLWVQQMAVSWHEADLLSWWWLPLLFIGVSYLAIGMSRRRNRPDRLR